MIDAGLRFPADAKGDVAHDIIHDGFDFGCDLAGFSVRENSEIAAGDIETNSGQRNFILVGHHPTNGLCIAFMSIGPKHAPFAAGIDTIFDLAECRIVVLAEYLRLHCISLSTMLSSGQKSKDAWEETWNDR